MNTGKSDHSARCFDKLLNPRGIAVVGASQQLGRIGGQPVRNLSNLGYQGKIYPVNPKYPEIKGYRCYADVREVPQPCDLAVIVVAAPLIPKVIKHCGKAGMAFAVILSSGFGETGEDGEALQQELSTALETSGVRVLGPNCVGVLNLRTRMYCGMGTGFQDPKLKAGRVAMVTQSGGIGFAIVTLAQRAGIGFNYVVSSGNEADISTPELIDYFLEQDDIDIVASYIEGITDGRAFLGCGEKALRAGKPVLVWKNGNSRTGQRAAASHTAHLTASYDLYQAAFRSGGFIEVDDVDDFTDIVHGFARRKLPKGRNVAIVTTSGGAGVVLADRCEEAGLVLPALSESIERLRSFLPAFAGFGNPLDLTAQGQNDLALSPHNKVVSALLADPTVDQVIVRNGNVHDAAGETWAHELIEINNRTEKPIMVSWGIVIDGTDSVAAKLRENGVPCYATPLRLARAMGALTAFSEKRLKRSGRPGKRSVATRELGLHGQSGTLGEHASKKLLAAYGIPVVQERLYRIDEMVNLSASAIPFPVALKIESPDIPHKTEAGAVKLGIRSIEELREAARVILENAKRFRPDARIDGMLIQEMISGIEAIVGIVNDKTFGPVVMFGLGGIYTELLRDITYRFAPFSEADATEMIGEIKASPLLYGYRGSAPIDLPCLAACLSRLSWLAADHVSTIAEIDVNPLFLRPGPGGPVAADCLVVLHERNCGEKR